ncbi:dihydrolipoamide acetyltransferase family protein [Thermoactinomyces mirandus]|uniref:Dihydrolipoamide acetyltransferase component of pyruvate dehydrogenase complex n=1 Tax=Thermoactinomyces mirandus TaxID=2756294 RepID=A0A7W2AS37_9BACL|nr:dihydrolipoamide acetyltransferase family protein [Thermoactinomyces mirandus]MBA4602046.1 2-oxo acid dehydrogenase subunit E2 [Thermoactinomyces mirandus]
MATEVIMPKLGMGMKEGTVVEWKKNIGEFVKKGDTVVVISSDKIEMDIEAPEDGVVIDITAKNGDVVPVGGVIGYIGAEGEKTESAVKPGVSSPNENRQAVSSSESAGEPALNRPVQKRKVRISPVARKMAEEAGLDPESVAGTGPQGRITKKDVEKAIAVRANIAPAHDQEQPGLSGEQEKEESGEKRIPVSGMRKVIAARMVESMQQSAQLTINMSVDVSDLQALRKQILSDVLERYETRLTVTDFIARAVVLSLLKHKRMNSTYMDDCIYTYSHVHLGVAVALEKGLVVPVVRNADRYSLVELSKTIKSLGSKARTGKLAVEEMKGSTFTITNLGAYGVEQFTPVLNPPEAGILGIGMIKDKPVYIGDTLERRSLLPLSLTFDHRVLDGAPAAQFLQTVKNILEHPHSMLL